MDILGIVLAGLLLLVTLNSTYFFLVKSRVRFVEWVVFNACAPSNIVYLIGFVVFLITRNRTILYASILPIFFFGGLGLFVFPWNGRNKIVQFSHIVMVSNILWAIYGIFSLGDYKAAALGLLIGTAVFVPFIAFQQSYANTHSEALQRVLGVSTESVHDKMRAGR